MEAEVRDLFRRYERHFNDAIEGHADFDAIRSLYAPEFIGASPAGVRAGRNDEEFKAAMEQGYAYYRRIGTREVRVREIDIVALDERHCVARVSWRSLYRREGKPDTVIDFGNAYLVQVLDGGAKVFGWVTGDEQALLREHGIV